MTIDLASVGQGNLPLGDIPAIRAVTQFSRHRLVGAGTTNATVVKAGPSLLVGAYLVNVAAAARFVKFYDKASAPTVGTDTPVITVQLAASTDKQLYFPLGDPFLLGLGYGTTVLGTDADATAITAGDVIVQLVYV